MSKVLEGLAHELWAAAQLAPGEGISDGVARINSLLEAQPAEAECVEIIGYVNPENIERMKHGELCGYMIEAKEDKRRSCAVMTVESHLAALSAVTAERDALREDRDSQQRVCIAEMEKVSQLRAEVEALRVALLGIASVNPAERGIEWAKACASDGLKGAGSELYARWLDTLKEAEALRKDAERWRYVRLQGDDTHWLNLLRVDLEDFGGSVDAAVDALIDGDSTALAAKEG